MFKYLFSRNTKADKPKQPPKQNELDDDEKMNENEQMLKRNEKASAKEHIDFFVWKDHEDHDGKYVNGTIYLHLS